MKTRGILFTATLFGIVAACGGDGDSDGQSGNARRPSGMVEGRVGAEPVTAPSGETV
jgi:hypothetical protein